MKYIYLLLLIGCTKQPEGMVHIPYEGRTGFPTSIYMGQDYTIPRSDSFAFTEYTSYLATCGTSPETEAPTMGIKIYPILFPSYVWIRWTTYQGKQIPYVVGLKPGVYKFVGTAYMFGFRTCDNTYQNVEVYDTMTLTVLKKHRYGGQ